MLLLAMLCSWPYHNTLPCMFYSLLNTNARSQNEKFASLESILNGVYSTTDKLKPG